MKRIKIAFVLFISIAIFSSCQKEFGFAGSPSDQPQGSPSGSVSDKVKTYTEDYTTSSGHTVVTFNVSYDANDRITSMTSVSSPGDKFVYTYNSNNTYTFDIYNSNKVSIHVLYFTNSLSLIDSSFQYNDTQDTSAEKYIYNGRQLTQLKEYNYVAGVGAVLTNLHNYTYDLNGNMLKDATANAVTTYEYYDNLFDNLSIGNVYTRPNKNLVKTTTVTEGGISEKSDHTYTFDNRNRLTSEKIVTSTGEVAIKSYTY